MSGHSLAIANMKGGVGKTTTVVMLAEGLAASGYSVLVVDLDPQASASVSLAGENTLAQMIRAGRTLDAYLALRIVRDERPDLTARIHRGISLSSLAGAPLTLSLLPSGPFLRVIEREITYELTRRNYNMNAIEGELWRLFRKEFAPLTEQFDYVLYDCAPGISPMTEIAVRACDLVVVASIPDFLSTFGLAAFFQTFWGHVTQSTLLAPRRRPHILATRVQKHLKQHRATLDRLYREAEDSGAFRMLNTMVPQAAAFANALLQKDERPTLAAKYGTMVSTVIAPLVHELEAILHGD